MLKLWLKYCFSSDYKKRILAGLDKWGENGRLGKVLRNGWRLFFYRQLFRRT